MARSSDQKIYAFIDSQNLNLAIRRQGWILDFKKFHRYLKEKYGVSKTFLCIGYVRENRKLYEILKTDGYNLIFKPTLRGVNGHIKGNVDAELVLHTMIEFPNFDKAIIVSNDGDFYCLIDYLLKNDKLKKVFIPDRDTYSSLLKKFGRYMVYMNGLEKKLSKQKERH